MSNITAVVLGALTLLTACGGSSNKDEKKVTPLPKPTTQVVTGTVIDPEIANATVYLYKSGQTDPIASVITDEQGKFSIDSAPIGELANYYLQTKGGIDKATGLAFDNIVLSTPLSHYDAFSDVIISPLSSLINKETTDFDAELKQLTSLIGEVDLKADPRESLSLQKLTLKLSALLHRQYSASQIVSALDTEIGLTKSDLKQLIASQKAELLNRLSMRFDGMDNSENKEALIDAFKIGLISSTIFDIAKIDTLQPEQLTDTVKENVAVLAKHFLALAKTQNKATLSADEIIASVSHGDTLTLEKLQSTNDSENPFSVESYRYIKVGLDSALEGNLSLMYYALPNSATGNHQLVMHDVEANTQTVVKTNVVLNGRNFIFEGDKKDDKTTFVSRKYGLMLDPNKHKETRTASSGAYGSYEYTFYSDNALLAYDANNPASERTIFDSDKIPAHLKGQIKVLGKEYEIIDNLNDADNSYAYVTAFESLADPQRSELSSSKKQVPLTVRLSDGNAVMGRPLALIKNEQGLTDKVIVSYVGVHTDSFYPSGSDQRRRLQLCENDLSTCEDIADGDYFLAAENTEYFYFTRQGYTEFYGLEKANLSFSKLTGSKYPGAFDAHRHLQGASGHGDDTVLNNFSSLGGITTNLSAGNVAYSVVNYDLDMQTPLGTFFENSPYELPMHIHKNGQVIKFEGLVATRMFDTGDGIDHGDASDGEPLGGHINLLTAEKGKLFIEIANYDAQSVGGQCVPQRGFGCFNVTYGHLTQDSVNKAELDSVLASKDNLKYLYVRRLPPFSINGVLYINLMDIPADRNTGYGHQYHLQGFNTDTLEKQYDTVGRSYFTLTARYDDGRIDGEVLAWNAKTGELKNITRDLVISPNMHEGIDDKHMIQSVLGAGNGLPVAGLGTVFALRADPGRHQWYMVAGQADKAGSLAHIDQLPFASWLYY